MSPQLSIVYPSDRESANFTLSLLHKQISGNYREMYVSFLGNFKIPTGTLNIKNSKQYSIMIESYFLDTVFLIT